VQGKRSLLVFFTDIACIYCIMLGFLINGQIRFTLFVSGLLVVVVGDVCDVFCVVLHLHVCGQFLR